MNEKPYGLGVIGVHVGDDLRTTNIDAARLWITYGPAPDDGLSVAVMVRAVSRFDRPIHAGILSLVCEAVRKAAIESLPPGSVELLAALVNSREAGEEKA